MPDEYYIGNYEGGFKILRYSPASDKYEEVWGTTRPRNEWARGFYVRKGDCLYGLYASPEGPICFRNSDRFPLADQRCKIDLAPGKGKNRFALYWNDKEQFSVTYPFPDPELPWGEWSSTAEDDDFFLWLLNRYQQGEKFVKLYTIPDTDV